MYSEGVNKTGKESYKFPYNFQVVLVKERTLTEAQNIFIRNISAWSRSGGVIYIS